MDRVLSIVLCLFAIAVFGWFAWAIRFHFTSTRMPWRMRMISALAVLGLLIGCATLLRAPPTPHRSLSAGLGVGLSAMIFAAALKASRGRGLTLAFDPLAPSELLEHGPYARVRHPFYLSYILFWCAIAIAAPVWPMALVAALLSILYFVSAKAEERALLGSPHADAYRALMRRTGFLWPRLRPLPSPPESLP